MVLSHRHRRNNRRDGWGPTMYFFPNFLAVVFKKQEISQQVVTRMQDLASEFSKNFPGVIPRTLRGRGRPPPAPNTQSGLWPGAGRRRSGVGTQTFVPLNFSAVVAPLVTGVSSETGGTPRLSKFGIT